MKAWRIEKHGGPEVLQWKDVTTPAPGPGEALIKVEAIGLNHLDLWVRNGVPGHRFPLPITPGCDIVGRIEEIGPISVTLEKALETREIKIGRSVILNPLLSCGTCESCLSGKQAICADFGIFGETRDGGCAEFVTAPVQNLILRPESISPAQACTIAVSAMTAWSMVTRKAKLKPGEFILIQAGGSGVSIAAIQFAKIMGAKIITTVGSDEKVEKALRLGADHVIQYKKSPFRDSIKKILKTYNRRGVAVVLDHVGKDTFTDSLKSLSWGGRMAICGATSGADVQVDLKQVFFKNISVFGTTMGSQADLIRILQLTEMGLFKPVIDSEFKLTELPYALKKLEGRDVFGKVVIKGDQF